MNKRINIKRFLALFLVICTVSALVSVPVLAASTYKAGYGYSKGKVYTVPAGKTTIIITTTIKYSGSTKEPTFKFYLHSEGGDFTTKSKWSTYRTISYGNPGKWTGIKSGTKFTVYADKTEKGFDVTFK